MASANEKQPCSGPRLLDLPLELVVQCVEHLARETQTLCSLARTCRLLQVECEKRIYTTIELLSTNDLRAILEAFSRRPERIASVETLKILYRFHTELGATLQERMAFNACVAKMKALKHWHVESPFDNFNWGRGGHEWVEHDMEEFRRALEAASFQMDGGRITNQADVGLSKLEKLVVHSHGADSDFWELDGFHCLFRHPSLRYLHASCFVLPKDLPELEPYAKTTPLTTLVFDECELEPKGLRYILRTPKSLKHLTLGENVYNTRVKGVSPRLSKAPEASLEALMEVASSLESLTHHDPYWKILSDAYRRRTIKGDGMRAFHRLNLLDTDPCSFLHQITLSHAQAPPNLQTLRIRHARAKIFDAGSHANNDLFEHLPPFEPYTYLASLKTLEFIQGAASDSWTARPDHICDAESVRLRHAYAYKLFKHGINMKMHLEATWREGLMPPYLHGEPKPELVCVYDAKQLGFRRHISDTSDPDADERRRLRDFFSQTGAPGEDTSVAALLRILNTPRTPLPTAPNVKQDLGEAPETDQLNSADILRLKNEVRRSLTQLWSRMAVIDGDDEDDDAPPAVHVVVDSDGSDDFGDEEEDDFDGDVWFDAEEMEEDDLESLGSGGSDDLLLQFGIPEHEYDEEGAFTEYDDDDDDLD